MTAFPKLRLTELTKFRKIDEARNMASATMLEILAGNVRREMEARGWTQTHLAKECNWPPSRITEILQGKFDPRLGTIERLAKAFGVPTSVLLTAPVEIAD